MGNSDEKDPGGKMTDQWQRVTDLYKKQSGIISDLVVGFGNQSRNIEELKKVSKQLVVAIMMVKPDERIL